jgi:hypothetical protein
MNGSSDSYWVEALLTRVLHELRSDGVLDTDRRDHTIILPDRRRAVASARQSAAHDDTVGDLLQVRSRT